jgi:predicted metal-dependent peptidase
VIYPRRRADDIGTVIFARDTSGSITDTVCAQYSALITDCVSELGCTGLVIDCDAHIQAEYTIDGFESCPLTAKGGGGTDFRPVFDRAAELIAEGQPVAGVVYLTDLCGPMPDESDIPTLWLSTTSRVAKFGRTVPIET